MVHLQKYSAVVLSLICLGSGSFLDADQWGQQNQVEEQEHCVEEETFQHPSCPSCKRPKWKHTRFADEQFQESSWPSRRGDELSDQLMR